MLTAPDLTWRVLTPPKTASTTIIHLLREEPFNAEYSGIQHDFDQIQGTMIVSVRNPFTRTVSLWRHALHERGVNDEAYPFATFMQDCRDGTLDDFYTYTMDHWLRWINRIDLFVRFEYLEDDLKAALPQYDWHGIEVPHENRNPVLLERSPLLKEEWQRTPVAIPDPLDDPDTVHLVRDYAAEDFVRFGYLPEWPL